ncbi:type 1 glutamine amidotransferase family protein [Staphylococcus borealis]|uniref:type 1 glutamine amidotransferase family protein n=1 Tax=Staphylococcus borealis TaxID=2742203 RepID=UPI000E6A3DD7|nr:type 1 glutamine amidotransferase family protein [Staphylococcus borealis]RIO69628.1 glutamine amidotransferase [Staphylococcus borealis]
MKKALFLLLDEFADWEGAYLSSILNQDDNWSVSTISVEENVSSLGGFSVLVDYIIGDEPKDYDLLVMIGGNSWDNDSENLLKFVEEAFNKNIVIGAICGAVDYLARNGFLNKYKHTGNSVYIWQNYKKYKPEYEFLEKQSVVDNMLITANGTASLEFTESILREIDFDSDKSIEKTIFMNRFGFYKYCEKYGNPYL